MKTSKKSVLITFDDGAIGVATNALPILNEYKMKGTIFIVGSRTKGNKSGTTGLMVAWRGISNEQFT